MCENRPDETLIGDIVRGFVAMRCCCCSVSFMLSFDLVLGVVDKGIRGKCFDAPKLFSHADRCENPKP